MTDEFEYSTIAVDFDGTIVEHEFPEIGASNPGAAETLRELRAAGHRIILYTMRSGEYLNDAIEYCRFNGIVLWHINQNPEQSEWTSSPKVYAHLYIDDAALGCPLWQTKNRPAVDWVEVRKLLKQKGYLE
jgi:hydroxymethylpyrimidine pyrophosphatase-like HAD family hydrolase